MLATLTRSQRRAVSRDAARANPVPGRQPSYGQVAEIVHARHPLPHLIVTPKSGKLRGNTKRNDRAAFWAEERRTVLIKVSVELEPYFRQQIKLLGDGARVDGSTKLIHSFASDLNVHIPGAPNKAVRAIPAYRSVWHGDHYEPKLESVAWFDADGNGIETEVAR